MVCGLAAAFVLFLGICFIGGILGEYSDRKRRRKPLSEISWATVAAIRNPTSNLTDSQRSAAWRAVVDQRVQWSGVVFLALSSSIYLKMDGRASATSEVDAQLRDSADVAGRPLNSGDHVTVTGFIEGELSDASVRLADATVLRHSTSGPSQSSQIAA